MGLGNLRIGFILFRERISSDHVSSSERLFAGAMGSQVVLTSLRYLHQQVAGHPAHMRGHGRRWAWRSLRCCTPSPYSTGCFFLLVILDTPNIILSAET